MGTTLKELLSEGGLTSVLVLNSTFQRMHLKTSGCLQSTELHIASLHTMLKLVSGDTCVLCKYNTSFFKPQVVTRILFIVQ